LQIAASRFCGKESRGKSLIGSSERRSTGSPALQSFITLTVCLFTTWYIAFSARKDPSRGPSFLFALRLIAGAERGQMVEGQIGP
jgi:hypothetical protein